ncbi:cereblon family protein [Thermodesulfobacteriota bacterium]
METSSLFCFRADKPHELGFGLFVEQEDAEKETEREEKLCCNQCLHIITGPSERTVVQGSFDHTFANPHGFVFHIGCFTSAPGCRYAGPSSPEFSWFRGFSWRVAVCGRCLAHMGWLFTTDEGARFHGLILNRLVEPGR